MDFIEMNANKCVVNMQSYFLLIPKVVFWMFLLSLWFQLAEASFL